MSFYPYKKMLNFAQDMRKVKQNYRMKPFFTYQVGKYISGGEPIGKWALAYTAEGNVKWYNHNRRESGNI